MIGKVLKGFSLAILLAGSCYLGGHLAQRENRLNKIYYSNNPRVLEGRVISDSVKPVFTLPSNYIFSLDTEHGRKTLVVDQGGKDGEKLDVEINPGDSLKILLTREQTYDLNDLSIDYRQISGQNYEPVKRFFRNQVKATR